MNEASPTPSPPSLTEPAAASTTASPAAAPVSAGAQDAPAAPSLLPPVASADVPDALPVGKSSLHQRWLPWVCLALCLGGLTWIYSLQERLKASEQQFARRHEEALQQVVEARTMAKQAEAVTRDMVGKLSLVEAKVSESTLQRTQLEDLMQSLSRSRDENVLADIEAALRVAQQHAALTGSTEPLVNALKQTEERLSRVQQPRLERVRRAVLSDLDRVRAVGSVDLTSLTLRLDEVARQVDELPLLAARDKAVTGGAENGKSKASGSAVAQASVAASAAGEGGTVLNGWLTRTQEMGKHIWSEVRQLVRVTRLDHPEAALLAPEQAVYLRDNLRLRLLSARLSLLSRQFEVAQSDMKQAQALLDRYFDRQSRRVAAASELLRQTTAQARAVEVPRPTATLTAITAATAGR